MKHAFGIDSGIPRPRRGRWHPVGSQLLARAIPAVASPCSLCQLLPLPLERLMRSQIGAPRDSRVARSGAAAVSIFVAVAVAVAVAVSRHPPINPEAP